MPQVELNVVSQALFSAISGSRTIGALSCSLSMVDFAFIFTILGAYLKTELTNLLATTLGDNILDDRDLGLSRGS